MKTFERYRIIWQRFWIRVVIEMDNETMEQAERSLKLNIERLNKLNKRYGEITPAHILMREVGK